MQRKFDAKNDFRIIAAISSAALITSSIVFGNNIELMIVFAFISAAPLFAFFVLPTYLIAKQTAKIEKDLVNALYQASSISSFASIEEIFHEISTQKTALGNEFKKVYNEIKNGNSIENALHNMVERNNSKLLQRAVELLILGYKSGADISQALQSIADDANASFSIKNQRSAALIIEKITLLSAAGFIVPILVGSMISLIKSLDIGSLVELGIGLEPSAKEALLQSSILGNQIYVFMYSIIASVVVAYQEGKIENTFLYITLLVPCSMLLFNLLLKMNVLSLIG